MNTGSKDDGGFSRVEADAMEPRSLSATAFGGSADSRPRMPRAPGHQQAVELVSLARRHLREGQPEEAKKLFGQAAELERQVLRRVEAQPERSLVAEYGARAALQDGRFSLAKELVRKGLPQASAEMQWSLLRVEIEAELLEFLEEHEHGWEIPWDSAEENDDRVVVTARSGRRFVFYIDPEVDSVTDTTSTSDEVAFTIPASRLNIAALETAVAHRLRPRRHVQLLQEQRGFIHRYLLDVVPV